MGAYLELGVYSWTYGNSVHGPNLIHASSSGSMFHALRTHSISYFHERGGLICNLSLKEGRNREGA